MISWSLWALVALAACPRARDARWAGDARAAEAAARTCVARAPEDAAALLELSRALALGAHWPEARTWAHRARAAAPDAAEARIWSARLAYWAGDLRRAQAELEPVLDDLSAPEAWELAGRIALAAGEARRAEVLFTTSLALDDEITPARFGRAAARARLGEPGAAFDDLDAACRSTRCRDHWRGWRNLAPIAAHGRSEALTGLRGDGAQVDSTLSARFSLPRGLGLGPVAVARVRTDAEADAALGASVSQRLTRHLRLGAEARFGLARATLPAADVRGALSISALGPLWIDVGGRYLSFSDEEAGVFEPRVCGDAGVVGACGRYSAVFSAGSLRHFGLLQGWANIDRRWTLRAGTGGGTTNDFMVVRRATAAWSIVGYGGFEYLFGRRHGASLTYTYRRESQPGGARLDLHQLGLAYDLRLGW